MLSSSVLGHSLFFRGGEKGGWGGLRAQAVLLNIFRIVGIATYLVSSSVVGARDTKIKEGIKEALMLPKFIDGHHQVV